MNDKSTQTKVKMSKHLGIVFKEMCKRVGADYRKVDVTKEGWFSEYKWTEKEQEDFKKWMVDYLYNNTEARHELLEIPFRAKKAIKKAVDWFIFDYGWAYKDEEKQ